MKLDQKGALRLVTLLSGAIKGVNFYPPGHPAVKQPLQEITTGLLSMFQEQADVRLGLHDGAFFFADHLFLTPPPAVEELASRLTAKKIDGVMLLRGLQPEDLIRFVALMAEKQTPGAEMVKRLADEGVRHITLQVQEEEEDQEFGALETYGQALEAIRDVIKDIEKGRIPHSGKILSVVRNMVTMTIQDPSTLLGLSMIKDYDNYTFNHCVNVGVLSMALSASLGRNRDEIEEVGVAGFLHDIGKTKVDKKILNKPGKLDDAELVEMRKHAEIGAAIVADMEGMSPPISQAVLGHHICYNHQGYPSWAREQSFNWMSGVLSVADCYDAITTLRVYQRPLSPKAAVDKIHELAGTVLDAGLVTSFVEMMGKYPVGTLVRLDTNEIAVVYRPNPANSEYPVVKVIFDPAGELIEPPHVMQLADPGVDGPREIVAVVDPLYKNIEVGKYLS